MMYAQREARIAVVTRVFGKLFSKDQYHG